MFRYIRQPEEAQMQGVRENHLQQACPDLRRGKRLDRRPAQIQAGHQNDYDRRQVENVQKCDISRAFDLYKQSRVVMPQAAYEDKWKQIPKILHHRREHLAVDVEDPADDRPADRRQGQKGRRCREQAADEHKEAEADLLGPAGTRKDIGHLRHERQRRIEEHEGAGGQGEGRQFLDGVWIPRKCAVLKLLGKQHRKPG